jgi:hypothetical protein
MELIIAGIVLPFAMTLISFPLSYFILDGGFLASPANYLAFFAAFLVAAYGISFGAFYGTQAQNCKRTDAGKIAANAGIGTAIIAGFLVWASIPFLSGFVSRVFDSFAPSFSNSLTYAFFALFGGVYAAAIGGSLSGICP